MAARSYLRPTAFVDAPFGLDGRVARLAGGMAWFSAVEVMTLEDGRVAGTELVPVERIEDRLAALGGETAESWRRITAARPPLALGDRIVRLDQPQVAGILNVTPDSFSDGGRFRSAEEAAEAGFAMAAAGAAMIDVGGESTRPGAKPVWEGDEAERVVPAVRQLAGSGTAVSVDTRKAAVMEAALAAGAAMVNDVSALTFDERAAATVAAAGCPIVLMHHQGPPETMQAAPHYDRPVTIAVYDWLEARIRDAEAAGIRRERIVVDPGIGFGKTVQHNLQLLNNLALLHGLGCPIMLGASRKRMIGALSGEAAPDARLAGSLALALKGVEQGVHLLRVHDVPETVQALRVWRGLRDAALTPPAAV
ncbi:MAG: dihydropteroate synthase [Alphaproteobacteria bacterium]|nr:dihydropteroate synthase [Alphaproteobacteria bacterium]MBV9372961.1 dihydropteroate synthase [Alphaproteobacteria bacterium]MBV9901328.1 dihydropteroate synthase [Alphaproteobacteria bacterium]